MQRVALIALLAGCSDVTATEARRLVAHGALLVDVRSPEEYRDGHLPGARNLPIDQVRAHPEKLKTLPRRKPLLVYCHTGARAFFVARWLRAEGFDVRLLGSMNHFFGDKPSETPLF